MSLSVCRLKRCHTCHCRMKYLKFASFVFILLRFLHPIFALSALDVYLHVLNKVGRTQLNEDIILISDSDQSLYDSTLTGTGSHSLQLTGHLIPSSVANLTEALKIFLKSEIPLILIVNLSSIEMTGNLLQTYQKLWSYFHQPMKIFVIMPVEFDDFREDWIMRTALQFFPNSSLIPNLISDVYVVHTDTAELGTETKSSLIIHEIYSIRNKPFIQSVQIEEGLESILVELSAKASRRNDFRKVPIRGVVPGKNNAAGRDIHYNVDWDPTTGKYEFLGGYRVEEFAYLRDSLNFEPIAVVGEGYVALAPNGSLLGIGKDIVEDIADIGIPSSEIVPYRVKHLTFLHPTSDQRLFSFFKQPPPNAVREIYSQTFTRKLWLAYFANWTFFAANAIILMWLWRRSYAGFRSWGTDGIGISDYIFWTFAVILQQGSSRFSKPEPGAMKIVIIFGLVTSTTLYAAYCGSLVSILMTPVIPIKSFTDLLEKKFILYGEKFTLQANSFLTAMRGNRSAHPEHDPENTWGALDFEADHAIDKIVGTKSTLIAPKSLFYSYVTEKKYPILFICEQLSGVSVDIYPTKTGMFVKKGSPLKEVLNFRILRMFERGIRQRIETRLKKGTTVTCFKPGEGATFQSSLGIKDVFTAVVILALGFFASFICFILEKVFCRTYVKPT